MRPTGQLHLGHYHGVLKNWIKLQYEYDCYFFVADLHALTTHYEDPQIISASVIDMVIDWLAAGVNPASAKLFVQSDVPQHAELHLLLSMLTPLGWLERVPTYKDQQEKLRERDLATYGFLGYPLLQSAKSRGASITSMAANRISKRKPTRRSGKWARSRPGCTARCAGTTRKRATRRRSRSPAHCSRGRATWRSETANACGVTWKAVGVSFCRNRTPC
jgi:hypothetical protein